MRYVRLPLNLSSVFFSRKQGDLTSLRAQAGTRAKAIESVAAEKEGTDLSLLAACPPALGPESREMSRSGVLSASQLVTGFDMGLDLDFKSRVGR